MKKRIEEMKGGLIIMEKKYILGFSALALVAILGLASVSAFGFGGGLMNKFSEEDRLAFQEEREAIQTAISEGDYTTWKTLMEANIVRMQSQLTEEDFNLLVERDQKRNELRASGEMGCQGGLNEDCPFAGERLEKMNSGEGFGKMHSKGMGSCPFAE